jgi:hypothetical protein
LITNRILVADLADGRQELIGQVAVLVVDDEDPVVTGRNGNIAALSLQHDNGIGQRRWHVLHGGVLRVGRLNGETEQGQAQQGGGGGFDHVALRIARRRTTR